MWCSNLIFGFSTSLCADKCYDPLGMENKEIEDRKISFSTPLQNVTKTKDGESQPTPGRLNFLPWIPDENDNRKYIQVDFNSASYLTGVALQGIDDENYVTTLQIEYINVGDDAEWQPITNPGSDTAKVGYRSKSTRLSRLLSKKYEFISENRSENESFENRYKMSQRFQKCKHKPCARH